MKIITAKHAGFCFGVKRAVDIARSTLENTLDNVYITGEIVHNKTVVTELADKGLKNAQSINDIPDGSTLILKAHGSASECYDYARRKNLKIIDATCPMVTEIHKKAQKLEEMGYQVLVYGDKDHEEVIGICGHLKNPRVVRTVDDIKILNLSGKVGMVCQSTQKIDEIITVCAEIEKRTKEFIFENTLCETTKLRQKEVKELAGSSDAVIVVGSKNSANTKHLCEEATKINRNTFWIETADDAASLNFDDNQTVAIISGASTPKSTIKAIAERLSSSQS